MWNGVQDDIKGPPRLVSDLLAQIDAAQPFGSFQDAEEVAVFSDYGGEHKQSLFHTYSFLVCDSCVAGAPAEELKAIRTRWLADSREMAFKKLKGDGVLRNGLVPFISWANSLHALCITLVVPKCLRLSTPAQLDSNDAVAPINSLAAYKPQVQERAHWIVQTVAMVYSGLCRDGQRAVWVTDADTLCSNASQREGLLRLVATAVSNFGPRLIDVAFLATGDPRANMYAKDFTSIPDLLAGAWADVINHETLARMVNSGVRNATAATQLNPHASTILSQLGLAADCPLRSIAIGLHREDEAHPLVATKLDFQ